MSNKNDLNNEPLNDEETPFNDVNGSESESVILSEKDYLAEKELANFLEGGDSAVSQIMQQNADLKLSVLDLKSRNRKVWTAVILLILTICGLVFVWLNYFPKYKYIVTTNNAAVCEAGTLNAPLATPASLTAFAADAAVNSYTYDYVNYRQDLNRIANAYYTPNGRKAFFDTLDNSQNLKKVIEGRYILKSYIFQAPQLQEEGVKGGRPFWIVMVPMRIEFFTGSLNMPTNSQSFMARVILIQEPATAANLKGIAVDGITLSPYVSN